MRHLGAIRAARGAATPGVLAHSMQRRWLASSAAAAAAFPRDLTEAEIGSFHRDGYCIVRGMFSKEEAGHLLEAGRNDRLLQEQAFDQEDQDGKSSKLLVWNQPVPANNVFNAVARSPRIVNAATTLLGGEVYHWHSKLMLKEPEVGGAWEWHQDYGYWYNQGLLYPDLLSAMVALEPASQENGCLQLLRGTQSMGRIDHSLVGQQQGADFERVSSAMERHDLVYATMEAGDVCFFHALTLHASSPNTSSDSRWALTCCYNLRKNDPIEESFHPGYTPLEMLGDEHVCKVGPVAEWTEASDVLGADVNESQAAWAEK